MSSRSLLVATRNQGKLKELRQLVADLPFSLLSLTDFPNVEMVDETGQTFVDNACLKAASYAKQTGLMTLADDSGLEVDALNGAPGVLSARYGDLASDESRTGKLLIGLANVIDANRTARFVSVVAIADKEGKIVHVSTGTCEGRIAFAPRGSNGFGYDPIFIPDGHELTFAELGSAVKNQISHRARALRGARTFLRTLTDTSSGR